MGICINVEGQKMHAFLPMEELVSGSQEFVRFIFNLDETWDGLLTFAQFRQNGAAYNQYLDKNSSAYLPAEIKPGTCTLMLYGSHGNTIATTNYLTFRVNENNFISDAQSTEISQSLYNQLVTMVNSITSFDDQSVADIKKTQKDLQAQINNKAAQDDLTKEIVRAKKAETANANAIALKANQSQVDALQIQVAANKKYVDDLMRDASTNEVILVDEVTNIPYKLSMQNGKLTADDEFYDKGEAIDITADSPLITIENDKQILDGELTDRPGFMVWWFVANQDFEIWLDANWTRTWYCALNIYDNGAITADNARALYTNEQLLPLNADPLRVQVSAGQIVTMTTSSASSVINKFIFHTSLCEYDKSKLECVCTDADISISAVLTQSNPTNKKSGYMLQSSGLVAWNRYNSYLFEIDYDSQIYFDTNYKPQYCFMGIFETLANVETDKPQSYCGDNVDNTSYTLPRKASKIEVKAGQVIVVSVIASPDTEQFILHREYAKPIIDEVVDLRSDVDKVTPLLDEVPRLQKIANTNRHTCNIFRKVVCCGDSYTAGWMHDTNGKPQVTNEEYAYPHYAGLLTGNNWVNCGKSGATVVSWQTADRGLVKAREVGKAQAYIVGLMINDISYVNLGTLADTDTGADTYYGGMANIIRELNTISPNAKIFICTCPRDNTAFAPYNQAVYDIVDKYKGAYPVHCLDLLANIDLYQNASLTGDYINSHYTAIGYEQFAEILTFIMSDYINNHIEDFQDVPFIEYD